MSDFEKMDDAYENISLVQRELDKATVLPDPVARRVAMVRAAKTLRTTADLLDDHGRLEE